MRFRQELLRSNYAAGDYFHGGYYPAGGFFGSIGKALKKVAAPLAKSVGLGALNAIVPGSGALIGLAEKAFQGGGGQFATGKTPASMLQASGGLGAALAATTMGKKGKSTSGGGGGGAWTGGQGMLIGGTTKKRRRMNPLNPKALRRGMRRVQSFAHFAKRTIQFTQRVKMKKHRRRS